MGVWDNSDGNGGRALVRVRTQTAAGTVADLTEAVLHPGADITVEMPGRQTESEQTQPGYVDLVINNESGDYTPGVSSAPVALTQGMPLWWTETIGRRSFNLFTGALAQPTATFQNLGNGVGDRVAVTANDWMGQQADGGRTFISNLAEWIIYHGGSTLAGYWPMVETGKPFQPVVNTATSPSVSDNPMGLSERPLGGDVSITAASTVMPLGEDARIPTIGGPLDSAGQPAYLYYLGVSYPSPTLTIAAGQVLTCVAWVKPTLFTGLVQELLQAEITESPSGIINALYIDKAAGGGLSLTMTGGGLSGTITGGSMKSDHVYPVAIRFGFTPNVFEMWIDRTRYVGSLAGSPPTSYSLRDATSGLYGWQGGWGHLQVYVGAEADFTFTDYLVQIEHATSGLTGGLRWQRTDERIRTLAKYAGLTDAQLDLEQGAAWMPRATLAGSTFITEAQAAVDTEQGRLLMTGDGNLRFDNRSTTRYNL